MNENPKPHGMKFLLVLLPAAVIVAILARAELTRWALLVGTVGILAHWAVSHDESDDGELADSSYFFGFVLTLVLLAVGLSRLGTVSDPAPARILDQAAIKTDSANSADRSRVQSVDSSNVVPKDEADPVLGFLEELAAALALTIVGLTVRQLRILNAGGSTVESASKQQAALNATLNSLVHVLAARPDVAVTRELDEARTRARDSALKFDQGLSDATKRMAASIAELEDAVSNATGTMMRSGSGLEDSLSHATIRIKSEVTNVLDSLAQQRQAAEQALADAQASAAQLHKRADEQLLAHTTMWNESLQKAQGAISSAHRVLDDEYQRGMEGFKKSGVAFHQLAEATVETIEKLPDPAERLEGLWTKVTALETELAGAIRGASAELGIMAAKSEQLNTGFDTLSGGVSRAASTLDGGSAKLGQSLKRELEQMNQIIEEYTRLLESTLRTAGRR